MLSYKIMSIDIRPSVQQYSHHRGVALIRSTEKSRPAILIGEEQDRTEQDRIKSRH